MTWWLAGLIAGVVAYLVDWVMWSKLLMKGTEHLVTMPAEGAQGVKMGPMLAKSLGLSLAFGLLLAYLYVQFMPDLWAGPGVMGGMEFGTVLWLPTIALATLGSGVWYDKARPLMMGIFWSWLVRMIAAGACVGILLK